MQRHATHNLGTGFQRDRNRQLPACCLHEGHDFILVDDPDFNESI